LKKERPEGFVEKTWSFLPTFGTVSTEMKHTRIISAFIKQEDKVMSKIAKFLCQ